jgi:hypothetical protein
MPGMPGMKGGMPGMPGGMPGMPGGMPNPGMKQMSAADFMSGNRGGFQPPEPPIQPLEPDMQEITQKVFADKVDDLVGLFAGAAGSRQGLKLLQNVLGGVVGAGGKQLANMLTKNPEQIVKMLESNPQRLEQLMHHMSNSKAGAKLTELLQKDPDGAALLGQKIFSMGLLDCGPLPFISISSIPPLRPNLYLQKIVSLLDLLE